MKIVIFVDFLNSKFNRDFELSNALLGQGHSVFLVSTMEQLNMYVADGLDRLIRGYSAGTVQLDEPYYDVGNKSIDEVVNDI